MTQNEKLSKVKNVIIEDYKEEIASNSYYNDIETWQEMVKMWGYTAKDLKEDVTTILKMHGVYDSCIDNDSLEIYADTPYGKDIKFIDYMKIVKKEFNNWLKERGK